jgi:hypothetical protein
MSAPFFDGLYFGTRSPRLLADTGSGSLAGGWIPLTTWCRLGRSCPMCRSVVAAASPGHRLLLYICTWRDGCFRTSGDSTGEAAKGAR